MSFSLPQEAGVGAFVVDVRGRLVRTLLSGAERAAGLHESVWDGTDDVGRRVTPGVYFYKVVTSRDQATQRIVLLP